MPAFGLIGAPVNAGDDLTKEFSQLDTIVRCERRNRVNDTVDGVILDEEFLTLRCDAEQHRSLIALRWFSREE